jgi:hypothetical protein
MRAGTVALSVRSSTPARRLPAGSAIVAVVAMFAALFGATTAGADTAPPSGVPATVSADSLPTAQINGVAYDQVIVGNTVYVTGEFTSARPAGSAAGSNESARSNLLAYNLTTGALSTTWKPTINAKGKSIIASADGKTIYVGGNFTTANGVTRNRVAAFDATTGTLVTGFNPNAQYRVDDLALSGTTLYIVGQFTAMGNKTRTRLAAVNATTGALMSWAPTADQEVLTVVATGGKVFVGGHFTTLDGSSQKGVGALDGTTGAVLPFPANTIVTNYGPNAGITALATDGTSVYGTGYVYHATTATSTGNLEGTFATDLNGKLIWVTGCQGDHYDVTVTGSVVYDVSHTHNCSASGGNPETDPRTFQHATAWTTSSSGKNNTSGTFSGRPHPLLLHWEPDLQPGTYTGLSQAGWTVESNSQYVVIGGEFPKVNGKAQYGLARFAVRAIAPNKEGPQGGSATTPTLTGVSPHSIKIAWTSAWDRDNATLTYQVLRGATASTATVIKTLTGSSDWWKLPALSFTDSTAAAGSSQTYRIRTTDPLGNTITSDPTTAKVP